MRKLTIIFGLLIGCAFAPMHSFAGQTYQVYEKMIRRRDISRFSEGDKIVYHKMNGQTETFILGKYISTGEQGRVFDLAGTEPPQVIKFSTEEDIHYLADEIGSFEHLEKQGVPHARLRSHSADFYVIKDKIHGETLYSLNARFDQLSYSERTQTLKQLSGALEHFERALFRGPYGFSDIHANNVMFDGKEIVVIDVTESHQHPDLTAKAFLADVGDLNFIGPALKLVKEDPVWLTRYYELRNTQAASFLFSEHPDAAAVRKELLLGHPVPGTIQARIVELAVKGSNSPELRSHFKPLLTNILARGELDIRSVPALTNLLVDETKSPSELVELANKWSKNYSQKATPVATFFRKFAMSASAEDIQSVFHQVPSEFKPLLVNSAVNTAKNTNELMHTLNLALSAQGAEDRDSQRTLLMKEHLQKLVQLGKTKGTKLFLELRDQVALGKSPKSQKAYEELYLELTRNALSEAKSAEEIFRCFNDAPARLTPEIQRQLALLPTGLKFYTCYLGSVIESLKIK